MNGAEKDPTEGITTQALGIHKNVDVVIENGIVAEIGEGVAQSLASQSGVTVIDARGLTLMPGLIDSHSHPLFAGSRAQETVLKAQGLSYEEIAARGGGITVTTRATREASSPALTEVFTRNAKQALARGVVLMEAKTGYGLSPEEELRHLKCIYEAIGAAEQGLFPRIAPTLLGPHAESPEYRGLESYVNALVEAVPQYVEAARAAESRGLKTQPLAADIFVERNYFTKEHGEKWLGAALQYGLDVHIHADEFSRSGGCDLAMALAKRQEQSPYNRRKNARVLSVSHCQYATETDLARLHSMDVVAIALPITSFFSSIPYVEAKKFRGTRIRVAIGSDFNPGSAPLNSLWFAAFLALSKSGFSLPEVLAGITTNAAYALGAESEYGMIAQGKPAHLIAFEGTEPEDFFVSPLGDHLRHVVTQ
jgi:imidazolonepropionase